MRTEWTVPCLDDVLKGVVTPISEIVRLSDSEAESFEPNTLSFFLLDFDRAFREESNAELEGDLGAALLP